MSGTRVQYGLSVRLIVLTGLLFSCDGVGEPTYECRVQDRLDWDDQQTLGKRVSIASKVVGNYQSLALSYVGVRYGTSEKRPHVIDGYGYYSLPFFSYDVFKIHVEDEGGRIIEKFAHGHPALAHTTDPPTECLWKPSGDFKLEEFGFNEQRPGYLRIFDLEDVIDCDGTTYTGTGKELLSVDLRGCLSRFCQEKGLEGDPYCR